MISDQHNQPAEVTKADPICRSCCRVLIVGGNWSPSSKAKRDYQCKPCQTSRSKQWKLENSERYHTYNAAYQRRQRDSVLAHYGGTPPKCACCGEATREFLCLHHVNNDGKAHRTEVNGQNHSDITWWLVKNGFPDTFKLQVLCHNCNAAKEFYGHCPHERVLA